MTHQELIRNAKRIDREIDSYAANAADMPASLVEEAQEAAEALQKAGIEPALADRLLGDEPEIVSPECLDFEYEKRAYE